MNSFLAQDSPESTAMKSLAHDSSAKQGVAFRGVCLSIRVMAAALPMLLAIGVAAQTLAPGGNVQDGRRAFTSQNCTTCHGPEGRGATGPRIVPPAGSFSDFVRSVRQPTGVMPPVTAQAASDSELANIYAFLRSIETPPLASISLASASAQNGKRIYTSYGCYQCHGHEGQGSTQTAGPRIGPPAISIAAFASAIRQPTNQMPPYTSKVVSDSDIADMYAFLQSIPMPPSATSIPLLNQ
jgi:mono/diheme cytochrome c family protein